MKKKSFIVIVIFLILIILGLCAYIAYDKEVFGNKEKKENNTVENKIEKNIDKSEDVENSDRVAESTYTTKLEGKTYTVDVDVDKYNNIFEYIEKQDDVSMYIMYCTSEDYEKSTAYSGKYEFSSSEVATVLSEMKNSDKNTHGGLGGTCVPTVVINYTRNNVSKHIDFYSIYAISDTNDGNIYKIYENNLTEIEEYPAYAFNNLSATLKDKLIEVAHRY